MSNPRKRLVLLAGVSFFLFPWLSARAQQAPPWTWRDASGKIRTRADLDEILREHEQWTESDKHQKDDLTGAKLLSADLDLARLSFANLANTNLCGASLTHANLYEADLYSADLTRANLESADLTHANLFGADLTDAELLDANLNGAVFQPKSLPKLEAIASAKNLELLTYWNNPNALVQLRQQFEEGGLREQERKITYALKRREAEEAWWRSRSKRLPFEDQTRAILWGPDSILANGGSFILNKVFFDWTCQYGMSPGRPLLLGVLLWILCSLVYFTFAHSPGYTGLYRVYGQSIHEPSSPQRNAERIAPPQTGKNRGPQWLIQLIWHEWLLFRASMFFSLMSAFNIGFRDINFGRWLRLLTRYEFDIRAVGWARVIAGWQSLISVYLIALWVLTYFGRPFG